jgi:hypothetical protein
VLTLADLLDLHRKLREKNVLSVFLDGTATDAGRQRMWRQHLDNEMRRLRQWLADSPHAEREEFERCAESLQSEVAALRDGIGAPGWAAYVAGGKVWHAAPVQAPMPSLAVWSTGICASPYFRAFKQLRPVILIVADARHAYIYSFTEGRLRRIRSLESNPVIETPYHMSNAPRQGFHQGVRGSPGRDEAERSIRSATGHMLDSVVDEATKAGGRDAWILLGGIPQVARDLAKRLGEASLTVRNVEPLDVHSTDAQLSAAAAQGASQLRDEHDLLRISLMIEAAGAGGHATLGPAATTEALKTGRVRELFFTRSFIESAGVDAEAAVRLAMDHGAVIEEVEREAAALLSRHGGVGASLRY